jgi:hypothetical protein
MCRYAIVTLALSLCVLMQTQAKSDHNGVADKNSGVPTITVTKLDIRDKTLNMSYEIRNESEQNVWILVGFGESDASADLVIDKNERTLLIRRRFDVPFFGGDVADGRYVTMRPGDTQRESVSLPVPVSLDYGFVDGQTGQARGLEHATRLAIEIGYYVSDLPVLIRRTLEEADRIGMKPKNDNDRRRFFYFKGSLYFNALNEILHQRDEEILLPYTRQWFKGEQVLRTVVENVDIPYEDKDDRQKLRRNSIDMPPCTRVEIQYRPSMLEYFFPYVGQQSLLSPAEKQSLESEKTIVIRDQKDVVSFVSNIEKGIPTDGTVRERTEAQVICYDDDEHLASFPIYNDESVVIDSKDRFTYPDGSPILRTLTPQIVPFELRVQCAANMRNLWYRLRLYYKAVGQIQMLYPAAAEWCDALGEAQRTMTKVDEFIIRPYMCPAAGEGKCHYAMNPNCKPDSPADVVLLFETKAGWNQNGGPDLFTFDNHDPKGGCVLLNDGTVKFIRTKEELQQLRWK